MGEPTETGGGRRPRAWPAVGAVGVVLSAATAALTVSHHQPLRGENGTPPQLFLIACFGAVGAFITWRQPGNVIGRLCCVIGVSDVLSTFAGAYAFDVYQPGGHRLPFAGFAAWLSAWAWFPGFVALVVLLPLLFPDGRPPTPRWWAVAAATVVPAAILGTVVVAAWPYRGRGMTPFADETAAPMPAWFESAGRWSQRSLAWIVPFALLSLVVRYARSSGRVRSQLRWFTVAAFTIVLITLDDFVTLPLALVWFKAVPWIPAAIVAAIVWHRLWDLDVVVRASLVFTTLTAGVVVVYIAAVAVFSALLGVTGTVPSLVATACVAIGFQPAKERVEGEIERWLFGGRRDARRAMSELGRHLRSSPVSEDALKDIAATLGTVLRVPWASITIAGAVASAEWGVLGGSSVSEPLVHRSEEVGSVAIGLRPAERGLSRPERAVLDDLLPIVAAAVHAVALNDEVRRSREQLVAAREEERRRLRRDLHDGLGPSLAGIAMEVQAARNLLEVDREAAARMLVSAEGWARDAIGEVRRVVYGLRPPVLDQLGLVRALEEHAANVGRPGGAEGVQISVEASGSFDAIPAAAEVASYLIALEALTNVLRHANATRCSIRLDAGPDRLEVVVADDGLGLDRPHGGLERDTGGVGLHSMRTRAEELGGTLAVTDAEPGVEVRASIPLGV